MYLLKRNGDGYGYGDGDGNGYGNGNGDGYGDGNGNGYGSGDPLTPVHLLYLAAVQPTCIY